MLAWVDSPALGVCLDTNVMSANGDTVADWLSLFPGRIGLVRLCDGNWHGWRAWGDGVLPVDRYLCQLTEGGYQAISPCISPVSATSALPPILMKRPWPP